MASWSQKQLYFMEGFFFFTSVARMTGVLPRMRLNITKKKKGFLLGPVWLASAAIVRYLQSEWVPAHLYLIQLCLLLSLRKRLLDRGILLLSYVDNLYKSRRFSLSTGSP